MASHSLFLYLVAVLGTASLLVLFFGSPVARNLLFRCFLVVVFLRFSLGLAVALNSAADYLFLDQQLQAHDLEIEQFQSRIIPIDMNATADSDAVRDSVIGFWESLSLAELNQKISDGIENFINLLALYLLKTILFPLGFFYAVITAVKLLWRVRLSPPDAAA